MIAPEFPYEAIVLGVTVYGGDDIDVAMRAFEAAADQAAIDAGAEMVVYAGPAIGPGHLVPGNEERPVVEAFAAKPGGTRLIGALYGVSGLQWRARHSGGLH